MYLIHFVTLTPTVIEAKKTDTPSIIVYAAQKMSSQRGISAKLKVVLNITLTTNDKKSDYYR
jgi:hypothetical protein